MNLLRKHVGDSHHRIQILVTAGPDGDDHWSLRIVDHGPGVAPGRAEHVFEEFVSTDGRLGSSGTGLGLAIVRSLVVTQEGTVEMRGDTGRWRTFVCTFPLVALPREAA